MQSSLCHLSLSFSFDSTTQSHVEDLSLPANEGPYASAAFFFTRPHPSTVALLEAAVVRAAKDQGRKPESIVMFEEMCGPKGEQRVSSGPMLEQSVPFHKDIYHCCCTIFLCGSGVATCMRTIMSTPQECHSRE